MHVTSARSRVAAAIATLILAAAAVVAGAVPPARGADAVAFSVDDFAGNAMGTRELVQPEPGSCDVTDDTSMVVGGGTMTVDIDVRDSRGCYFGSAQIRWTAPTSVDITQGGADRIQLNYRDVQSQTGNGVVFGLRVEDVNGAVASVGGLQRNVGSSGDFLTIRYAPDGPTDVSYLTNGAGIDKTQVKSITLLVAATTNDEDVAVTFDGIGTNVGEPAYASPAIESQSAYEFPASQSTTHSFTVTGYPTPDVTVTGAPGWLGWSTSSVAGGTLVTLTGNPGAEYGEASIGVHADVANSLVADRDVRIVTPSPVEVTYTSASTELGQAGPVVLGTVTATPAPRLLDSAQGLPAGTGLEVDGTDVLLTGIPTESGTFTVSALLGNDYRDATFSREIEVGAPAQLDAIDDLTLLRGEPIAPVSLEATGHPAPTFSSTALPEGLTLSSEGVLSGTPTTAGTTAVTVTASNAYGTSPQSFTIDAGDAPLLTLPSRIDPFAGAEVEFPVVVAGGPATVTASGLPDGLVLDLTGPEPRVTGVASLPDGVDQESGTAQITAANEYGATTVPIDWTVLRPTAPVITVQDQVRLTLGEAVDIAVGVTSLPQASLTADGLPAGVAWVPAPGGGRIVGTPEAAGTATITVTAENGLLDPVDATVDLVVELPQIDVHLSAGTVTAGNPIHVEASGFQPQERVQVWLNSDPVLLSSAEAGADGSLALTVTIPQDVSAGEHTLVVAGETGASGSAPVTVLEPAHSGGFDVAQPGGDAGDGGANAQDDEDTLAATGAEATGIIAVALMAILAGVMMVRRRTP